MPVLDEELFLDLLKCDVFDDSHWLLRPFAVEGFLEAGKWYMLRFNLTATRPGNRRRNKTTHLVRPLCKPFYAFGGADDSEPGLGRTFLRITRPEQK